MNSRAVSWISVIVVMTGLVFSSTGKAAVTRLEQSDSSVSYEGTWQTVQHPAVSGGSVAASATAGSRVTVRFTGTGITWISYNCTCAAGTAVVSVDAVSMGSMGGYYSGPEGPRNTFRITGLAYAEHVLTIDVTGQSLGGNNAYVVIDAFDVVDAFDANAPGVMSTEENGGTGVSVRTFGNWNTIYDPSVSGGTVYAGRAAGDAIEVRFTGTGIAWIGYLCPCAAGIARVLLDGEVVANAVSVPSTQRVPQKEIYRVEGLQARPHVLRIEVTGTSWGDNPWVVVDAFVVTTEENVIGRDAVAPTVTMTAPAEGAIVTGVVTLSANASDNTGVTRVSFHANSTFLGEDTTPPYSITRDTSGIRTDGAYVGFGGPVYKVYARAFDAAGNMEVSEPINVVVNHEDQVRPTIVATTPPQGATVSGTITLGVNVSDDQGIGRVQYKYGGGYVLANSWVAPFSLTLDTTRLPEGNNAIFAYAYDLDENGSGPTVFTFVVDNVPGQP